MNKKNSPAAAGTSTALVKAVDDAALIPLTKDNIVKLVNPHASPQEVVLFLNVCAMYGLNPFKREIYLIKYDPKDKASFVVGYESYLKRAERTGKWAGMESGTIDDPKTGQPIKAWAKIYRKDWSAPLYHEVYYSEYVQYAKGKDGKPYITKFWREKPRTMLKKVAIAQAMRMAFPDEFGGMPYTAEEMPVQHETLDKGPVQFVENKREPAKKDPEKTEPPAGESAGAEAEDVAGEQDESRDDIAGMADHGQPEMTGAELKKHQATIGAIKMVCDNQAIDYKDFKKYLLDLQEAPKNLGKHHFVRLKFGHPSLEEGDPKDVEGLLANLNKMLPKYIEKRMKEEKDAKGKKG